MTNWLAGITVAIFVLLLGLGRIDQAALAGGFIPARVGGHVLLDPSIRMLPVWLTPLTAALIHANWLHIGFNMLMLFFCGRFVEHVLGPKLMLLLYVMGAYASAATEWAITPSSADPMIGASGAISALVGTYALLYSQQQVKPIGPIPASVVRIAWLAAGWTMIQLMVGFVSFGGAGGIGRIAIGAHIGGFIAGLVVTRPLLHMRFRRWTN